MNVCIVEIQNEKSSLIRQRLSGLIAVMHFAKSAVNLARRSITEISKSILITLPIR